MSKQLKVNLHKIEDEDNDILKMATNALALNEWSSVFENHYVARRKREDVDVRIVSDETSIRDQKNSGRCWIFTTLSFYRSILINKSKPKLSSDSVTLSASYIYFWHLLESSASFMEKIYAHRDEPVNNHINMILMNYPVNDGASNTTGHLIVQKYGVVPELTMPDTEQSTNTEAMRTYIIKILRNAAYHIRNTGGNDKKFIAIRNRYLRIIRRVLVASLGEPPKTFTFSFEKDDDGKFLDVENITPVEFYNKYLKPHDKRVISLQTNCSLKTFPEGSWIYFKDKYTITNSSKEDLSILSADIHKTVEAMRKSIKDKVPVFTGTDIGNDFSEDLGWADIDLYKPEIILSKDDNEFLHKIPKDQYVHYGLYQPNHAMLVIGYGTENHNPDGKITHWLLENSWGDESGDEGLVRVSHEWMLRNLYVTVVQEQYLPKEYSKEPKEIKEYEIFDGIPDLL